MTLVSAVSLFSGDVGCTLAGFKRDFGSKHGGFSESGGRSRHSAEKLGVVSGNDGDDLLS